MQRSLYRSYIQSIKRNCYIFIIGILVPICSYSQLSRFKQYDVAQGICHPFVYTINQDKNGFLWLGTGEGLCLFDGFEFTYSSKTDSLPREVISASLTDGLGNIWFGFKNGELFSWNGAEFKEYNLGDEVQSMITGISETRMGAILVATSNAGIYLIKEGDEPIKLDNRFSDYLIATTLIDNDKLLLGTNDGLSIIEYSRDEFELDKEVLVEGLNYIKTQVIKKSPWSSSYLVGTEDEGLFLLHIKDSIQLIKIGENTPLAYDRIQDVFLDDDQNLWVCTYLSGLVKIDGLKEDGTYLKYSTYTKGSGLPTSFTKTVFQDREKNIWIGTYQNGLAYLAQQSFLFKNFTDLVESNDILSLASNDSILWLGTEKGVIQTSINTDGQSILIGPSQGLVNDQVISLYYQEGILWIGTNRNGIYKYNIQSGRATNFFRADNSLANSVNDITSDSDNLYAATKDGVYFFSLETDWQYHYSTLNGLPHNDIEQLFLDHENRLVFATRSNGIFEITDRGDVEEYFTVGQYELEFNSITQDVNNHIWISTYGQGVFQLLPDSVINITTRQGLKSDYCYSIVASDSNYVWVGHRLGMSRININDHSTKLFNTDYGIEGDCNLNAVDMNQAGLLFFGTTDGLVIYNAEKAAGASKPPRTNITKVLISDEEYNFSKPIVLPYAAYKLRIEFIGLNYSDPDAVTYQYKLDGYDMEWSDITDSKMAIYSRIEDGEYEFLLRSFNNEGFSEELPVSFALKVKLPFWKTWWFISLSVIIIVLGVVVIIKYRERQQKQIQEYLEKRLDERTREVVEQKEEIEIKNRDITDSINYAQRIQASILPPIKKLQHSFSGSFIFYQPRDIVSGDFYWYDRVSDDKFVIVCADSTGHGVPGAFMSMIGTTLIKDICMSSKADSPSQMLAQLDRELRNTLNQNREAEQSNDGMDIIVSEIDVKSNYLRYASAMRPMIIYRNGEQMYIKGSRSSVGGHYDKDDKKFTDEGIQLMKGDLIYMFSDGYPDQFGGPMGKKFKMVRLKNLLDDIHKKPMEEQYEYVKSTFNLWKEEYEQVDDVLFMGIKI